MDATLPDGFQLDAAPDPEPAPSADATPTAGAPPDGFVPDEPPMMDGLQNEIVNHMSFGLTDHASALAHAITANLREGVPFSQAYQDGLAQAQQPRAQFEEDHPAIAGAGAAVGDVATMRPLIGPASSFAKSLIGNTLLGGTLGGISGAANATAGAGETADDAGRGAVVGAGIGATLPIVGRYAAGPVADWLMRKFSSTGAANQATQQIASRIAQDTAADPTVGIGPITDQLKSAPDGTPLSLLDVAGANVKQLGKGVLRGPGAARQTGLDFVNDRDLGTPANGGEFDMFRTGGANDRTVAALTDALGADDAFATRDSIMQARKTASAPAYDAFRAEPPAPATDIAPFMRSPTFKSALGRANKSVLDEGGEPLTDYFDFNEAGDPTAVKNAAIPPDVLDRVKQGLDDTVQAAKTSGDAGATRTAAMLRGRFLNYMDTQYADTYPAARAAYSGPTQSMQAIDDGRDFFKLSPQEGQAKLAALTPDNQDLYRLGAKQALIDQVQSAPDGSNEIRKIFGSPQKRDQVAALFDNPDDLQTFTQKLGMENRMFQTKAQMTGGSDTAANMAEDSANKPDMMGQAARTAALVAAHEPVGATVSGLGLLSNFMKGQSNDPAVRAQIARQLFNSNPDEISQTLAQLNKIMSGPRSAPAVTKMLAAMPARYLDTRPQLLVPFMGGAKQDPEPAAPAE